MCILLLIVFSVLAVLAIANNSYDLGEFMLVMLCGVIIVMILLIVMIVNGRVIDAKIELYTQENAVIEEQIDKLVSEYMEFESDTFKALHNDSSITLVSLYPELKSDKLVESQIDIYLSNNCKIRDLKESKLNVSVAKWWLYFGS
jgi:hypothetical protein